MIKLAQTSDSIHEIYWMSYNPHWRSGSQMITPKAMNKNQNHSFIFIHIKLPIRVVSICAIESGNLWRCGATETQVWPKRLVFFQVLLQFTSSTWHMYPTEYWAQVLQVDLLASKTVYLCEDTRWFSTSFRSQRAFLSILLALHHSIKTPDRENWPLLLRLPILVPMIHNLLTGYCNNFMKLKPRVSFQHSIGWARIRSPI